MTQGHALDSADAAKSRRTTTLSSNGLLKALEQEEDNIEDPSRQRDLISDFFELRWLKLRAEMITTEGFDEIKTVNSKLAKRMSKLKNQCIDETRGKCSNSNLLCMKDVIKAVDHNSRESAVQEEAPNKLRSTLLKNAKNRGDDYDHHHANCIPALHAISRLLPDSRKKYAYTWLILF